MGVVPGYLLEFLSMMLQYLIQDKQCLKYYFTINPIQDGHFRYMREYKHRLHFGAQFQILLTFF